MSGVHLDRYKPGASCHQAGCRCDAAVEANRARAREHYYKVRRVRAGASKSPHRRVPSGAVVAHLHWLMDAHGMSAHSIAVAAGMDPNSVRAILRPGRKFIWQRSAQRLLAVRDASNGSTPIPTAVPQRQVQAMLALGYTKAAIQQATGTNTRTLWEIEHGIYPTVKRYTADRIAAFTEHAGVLIVDAKRATRYRRKGYRPPAWYDDGWQEPDDTIMPPTLPTAHKERVAEREQIIADAGYRKSARQLAEELGVAKRTVELTRRRLGMRPEERADDVA